MGELADFVEQEAADGTGLCWYNPRSGALLADPPRGWLELQFAKRTPLEKLRDMIDSAIGCNDVSVAKKVLDEVTLYPRKSELEDLGPKLGPINALRSYMKYARRTLRRHARSQS